MLVEGLAAEDIWKGDVKGVKVNGARNIGKGHPVKVRTLRRSTMQGLIVVSLIVEDIERRRKMCKRHWSAKYRSRSGVKIPAESVHLGEALCKVWWLEVLHLRRSGTLK